MPKCGHCGQFIYRKRRRPQWSAPLPQPMAIIARCTTCGETFNWLPPNFDMRHRYNATTHQFCGGAVELMAEPAE